MVNNVQPPPLQLKRSKGSVLGEMVNAEGEPADEQNLPLPPLFKTPNNAPISIDQSEKAYNDSLVSGAKIIAQVKNRPSKEENAPYLEDVEAKLNTFYEGKATYTVRRDIEAPPPQQPEMMDGGNLDLDFDIHDDRPEATTEDVAIAPRDYNGEDIKKYNMATRRQKGNGIEHYLNHYDHKSKEFIAHVNYGHNDKEEADKKGEPVVSNADIMAAQIMRLRRLQLQREEQDRDDIKPVTIKREKIVNAQTLNTILWCDGSQIINVMRDFVIISDGATDFDEQDFTALLGTPNGRAAGWLAVRYTDHLDLNPLEKIRYDHENLWIDFIADVEEEQPKNGPPADDDSFM